MNLEKAEIMKSQLHLFKSFLILLMAISHGFAQEGEEPHSAENPDEEDCKLYFFSSTNEHTGQTGRKVALNGMPLPDQKPQAKEETDQESEETYVDAFNLSLRHSTTDIYVPLVGNELTLSARRNTMEEVWGTHPGTLSPSVRPDRPFGLCWSSGLTPNIQFISHKKNSATEPSKCPADRPDFDYTIVTDDTGATHRFIWIVDANSNPASPTERFFPFPSNRTEQDTYQVRLSASGVGSSRVFTFERKYGTKLTFSPTSLEYTLPKSRVPNPPPDEIRYNFAQVRTARDRMGNELVYDYGGDVGTLIPSTITANGNRSIKIQRSGFRITTITDPRGHDITFNYDSMGLLRNVNYPEGKQTEYDYDSVNEVDSTPPDPEAKPKPPEIFTHVNLKKILAIDPVAAAQESSADGVTPSVPHGPTEFFYTLNTTKQNYSSHIKGYYTVTGEPRFVTTTKLPIGEASFSTQSVVKIEYTGNPALPRMTRSRVSTVVDAEQKARTYAFSNPEVIQMDEIEDLFLGNDPRTAPFLIIYKTLTITHPPAGIQGAVSEVFNFDLGAGLALGSVRDYSGNTTSYVYADTWSARTDFPWLPPQFDFFVGQHSDPTSQTDASGTKHFSYHDDLRILSSTTDQGGQKTAYGINSSGHREWEEVRGLDNQIFRRADFHYGSGFSGFVTKEIIKSGAGIGKDLITSYIPQQYGYVGDQIVDPGGLNLVTHTEYDANGNKVLVRDPRGKTTRFEYDKLNRLTKTTYHDDSFKKINYDARGNKIAELDENGNRTLYTYDALNRLRSAARDMNGNGLIDSGDLVAGYAYNNLNSKVAESDPNGNLTHYEYDSLQRLVVKTDPSGRTDFAYGSNSGSSVFDVSRFKPTWIRDPRGYVTEIVYDNSYRPVQKRVQYQLSPASYATSKMQYDAVGNLRISTDPLNKVTETIYNGLYQPETTIFCDETFISTSYTPAGLVLSKTDERQKTTETVYDLAGRAVEVLGPEVDDGTGAQVRPLTKTIYDAAGNVEAVINPREKRWDYVYDDRNRKTEEKQPVVDFINEAGQMVTGTEANRPVIKTEYDGVGNIMKVTDARGNSTVTRYDKANRATHVISPAVAVVDQAINGGNLKTVFPAARNVYDLNGNIRETWLGYALGQDAATPVTDVRRTALNTYTDSNHLETTRDAENILVSYEYDAAGNRTLVKDGKLQPTKFLYDGLNRNTMITDAIEKSTVFTYNGVNKTDRVDAMQQRTHYKYDTRHRLKEVTYFNEHGAQVNDAINATRTYGYDEAGNLLSVTEAAKGGKVDVAYTYDALNRQTSETSSGVKHTYRYDLAGNRVRTDYGGGSVLASTYDSHNRLETLTENGRVTTYRYDEAGNGVSKQLPNGDRVSTVFDALNRIKQTGSTASNSRLQFQYSYTYDLARNVSGIVESGLPDYNQTQRFTYDGINRLIEERSSEFGRKIYTYDAAGNRTRRHHEGEGWTAYYTYNNLNQLTGYREDDSDPRTLTYDLNGNRMTDDLFWSLRSFRYDYENRLIGVYGGIFYMYDYRTRRVERVEGTVATKVIFSGGTSVMEKENNAKTVEYVRGSDWGGGVGGLLYSVRNGTTSFNHYNNRGDVVTRTDEQGNNTYYSWYDAFGKQEYIWSNDGRMPKDRQFANTKEEDPTGLLNDGFRYRDLHTGTFITRDPAGFVDGPNLYTYVNQNPWTKFDPEGLNDTFGWNNAFANWVLPDPKNSFNEASRQAEIMFDSNASGLERAGGAAGYLGHGISTVIDLVPGVGNLKRAGVKAVIKAFAQTPGEIVAEGAEKLAKNADDIGSKSARGIVQDAADEAKKAVGEGRGGPHGTKVHSETERNIKRGNHENIHTEVSYKDGEPVPRETKGSVRLDAIEGPKDAPITAYDLKTGGAKLTEKRIEKIKDQAPKSLKNVEEIR
jgi:RHS repeat-associated protein